MDKFVDNLKILWSKTNRFHRGILLFVILEIQPFRGGQYGFYCNDPALSYQFNGDTISWKWLMSVCCLLPLAVMLIVERIYHNTDKGRPNKRALRWYKEYIYGYIVNLCIIQVLKHIVGSPRPHFFDTCMPNEGTTCEGSEFISSYTCSRARHWQWQSDKSFPSGHTSLALHAGFFIIYYFHRRIPRSQHTAYVVTCQALSGACAVWCAVSRMTDHRHHWWDVLAGAGIGATVLLYTTHRLCKNFECLAKSDLENTSNGDKNAPLVETSSPELSS